MVSIKTFRDLALSFEGTEELPHFEKTSFRIRNKIFATLSAKEAKAVLKLSLIDQSVFCAFDRTVIYPVPGGWGKKGYTCFELKKIRKQMLFDALHSAWLELAPQKIQKKEE